MTSDGERGTTVVMRTGHLNYWVSSVQLLAGAASVSVDVTQLLAGAPQPSPGYLNYWLSAHPPPYPPPLPSRYGGGLCRMCCPITSGNIRHSHGAVPLAEFGDAQWIVPYGDDL